MAKNLQELRSRVNEIKVELRGMIERAGDIGNLGDPDARRFDDLSTEAKEARAEIERIEARTEYAKQLAMTPGHTEAGSDQGRGDIAGYVPTSTRDAALRTLERSVKAKQLTDTGAEKVEKIVRRGDTWIARWAVACGDPDYATAFAKLAADPERGHMRWTSEEQRAYNAVEDVAGEQRAMGLTGANGGFLVPIHLDPAVMLTNNGSINPLRQISRVVQITESSWNGVTSAGASAEWIAEATEVADGSPTLAQPNVPTFKGDSFVPYSFEVGDDAANFLAELQKLLVDAADQLMATAYTTGNGTTQPEGIITGLAGTSSEINTTGGTEAIVASDAYALQQALPPRFQANAQWTANLSIINQFRQFETTNGALKFPGLQTNPPSLLGRTVHENSNMDGVINAAATENNYVLLYGDFQNFLIVDRIGTRIEFIPNLVGANRRPTGQRGALLWFRTGSKVLVPNAFRMLDVPTTV